MKKGKFFFETNKQAKDKRRVYWVSTTGEICDLPPSGKPPIITGFSDADPNRILIVSDESNIPADINPFSIGLTAQALEALLELFKVNDAS